MLKAATVGLAVAATTLVPSAGASEGSEEQKVQAVIERMTSAFQDGDIDTVMASYEAGASIVFEPGKPVSNADVARQMFTGMAAIKPKFKYSGHEVVVTGDIAVHFSPWEMTATAPDGTPVKQSGLSVAVLRKQANGTWLMVVDNPHGQRLLAE